MKPTNSKSTHIHRVPKPPSKPAEEISDEEILETLKSRRRMIDIKTANRISTGIIDLLNRETDRPDSEEEHNRAAMSGFFGVCLAFHSFAQLFEECPEPIQAILDPIENLIRIITAGAGLGLARVPTRPYPDTDPDKD